MKPHCPIHAKNLVSFFFLLILQLAPFTAVFSQSQGQISGVVLDKQTQNPLEGVTIRASTPGAATVSDSAGRFSFRNITYGTYEITFSRIGYRQRTLFDLIVSSGNIVVLTVEMEPEPTGLSAVTITAGRRSARAATLETPLSVQRLTAEEIRSSPGGNFDISKAIQVLPGVGGGQQGGAYRNDIVIRGGAPNENLFYLDGVEIPVLNHFQTQGSSGGPQGMLNTSFIEDVKLSTSAFDARYDNAMSSVFQFREKNGNAQHLQGNLRLSATELAATFDGPLSKDRKTTFLFSARRSYLQFLFSLIDLPIRPNYWDFQTRVVRQLDSRTTLSFIGLGAIDHFHFAPIRNATPEKLYVLNSNPIINQWNYTGGITLKRLYKQGYFNMALSRNSFDNDDKQYTDNQHPLPADATLLYHSRETENKLRAEMTQNGNGWKISYGASLQWIQYSNNTFNVYRRAITDSSGNVLQPGVTYDFTSPLTHLWKFGAFAEAGHRFLSDRLGVNGGIRADGNSFTTDGANPGKTISPRLSLSYTIADGWTINGTVGRYYKLPPYTLLGFADNSGTLVNRKSRYLRGDHLTVGAEWLPSESLRFTLEGFYKWYDAEPVSLRTGIALANLGADFSVLGNEAVTTTGKGKTYGAEFFAQKKLTRRVFAILSYTWYHSLYSGLDGVFRPSNWDNRHLLTAALGYKLPRNWELGLKLRLQGGAPYTPYDTLASRRNYLSLGQGVFDYTALNSLRLGLFNSSDLRIDKKWNLRHTSIDLYLDITDWYAAKVPASASYSFRRNSSNTAFLTTDGQNIKPDGSNAIPSYIDNASSNFTPTIGFIFEF